MAPSAEPAAPRPFPIDPADGDHAVLVVSVPKRLATRMALVCAREGETLEELVLGALETHVDECLIEDDHVSDVEVAAAMGLLIRATLAVLAIAALLHLAGGFP